MKIRAAIASDATKIALAEAKVFPDPWSEGDINDIICKDGAICYCATSDDGCELYAYVIGRQIAPEGEIYRIATLPEYRKRGIAYRLLDYAVKCERGNGLESLFLEVREQNTPARNLYSAYGYREIGKRRGYYKNPPDDAVIMLLGK